MTGLALVRYRVTVSYVDETPPLSCTKVSYQEAVETLHEFIRDSGCMAVMQDELGGAITIRLYDSEGHVSTLELREDW